MQTAISTEELARFQSQLLELKKSKYSSDESLARSEKHVSELEDLLAQKSCELAEANSKLSGIQRAGDIDAVSKDNHVLRQKLINLESSFKLQTSTLRSECERLQNENIILLSTLKTAGKSCHLVTTCVDRSIQTHDHIQPLTFNNSCQTNFEDTRSNLITSSIQTDLSLQALAYLEANLQLKSTEILSMQSKFDELNKQFVEEKITWCLKCDESDAQLENLLIDFNLAKDESESLRNELEIVQTRNEKVVKELRRQIASSIRCQNSSNFVYVNFPDDDCQQKSGTLIRNACQSSEATSTSSFSLLPTTAKYGVGDECSESSSTSNYALISQSFSEDDFRCLLNRLSEVQEENCIFRRQIKQLTSELEAKSAIIQQSLDKKIMHKNQASTSLMSPESVCLPKRPAVAAESIPSTSSKTTPDLLSVAITNLRSRLISFDHTSIPKFSADAPTNLRELRGLKQLCEELMTRNIILESSLEDTLHKGLSRIES